MTHAPGFSTYDYVQRWMVSQSKELAGAEISQGSCDSHLNPRGETVNAELEKNNFKVAENILCQITGELVSLGVQTLQNISVYVTGNKVQLPS